MSMFSLGGNAGFALGPLLVTPAVLAFGLPGTQLALIPLWLAAGLLARELGRLRAHAPAPARMENGRKVKVGRDEWGPFARLASVVGLRSAVFFGLQAFVQIYYHRYLPGRVDAVTAPGGGVGAAAADARSWITAELLRPRTFVSCLGDMTLPATWTGRRPRGPARCHGWSHTALRGRVGDPPDSTD